MALPNCNACGYEVPVLNHVFQLSDAPNLVTEGPGDKYIGYEHIGRAYSGSRRYLIDERDALAAEKISRLTGSGTLLDLACGDGCITVPSARLGTQIIAGDISNAMLSVLQEKALANDVSLKKVTLCRMNALEIPLADESIDTVIANSVLHLISNPQKVVYEILRVLKPGGKFICMEDTPGKHADTSFDNTTYIQMVNSLYRAYWEKLSSQGVVPLNYSWRFYRDELCEKLFADRESFSIERGKIYSVTLKEGFLNRLIARGFSDQTKVPPALHETVIRELLAEYRAKYGESFDETSSTYVEDDINLYKRRGRAMNKIKNLKFLFVRAWTLSKGYFLLCLVRNLFTGLLPLINVFGVGIIVDALLKGKSQREILGVITLYLSVNLAVSVIRHTLTLLDNLAMRRITNTVQYEYMSDSICVDYHYVQDGSMMNLKRRSMTAHPAFFISTWGSFFNYLVQSAGVLFIFSVLSPWFVLIITAISAGLIWMSLLSQKEEFNFNNSRVEDDRRLEYLYSVMTEYKYAKEIRINNAGQFIREKYVSLFGRQISRLRSLYRRKFGLQGLSNLLTILQTAVMFIYFTGQVCTNQVSIAEYTVLLSSTTLFTSILLNLFKTAGAINNNCKSIEFYREYLDTVQKHSEIYRSNALPEPALDFSDEKICFENVSFAYPNTGQYILRDVNLEIRHGEKIGIVGLNGSGKTTLVHLLCRVYDPSEGRITLNGVDIRQIPYRTYCRHIGIVLQDFALFAYSVRENIMFDSAADEEKLQRCLDALKKSGLADKIARLPKGLNTSVYRKLDREGIEFSGGEGQKLAMARAVFKDADLLILDEPTSALDPLAEHEFFSRLNDISDGRTALFISHRLTSTYLCDKIYVIAHSRIAECGTHEALMARDGIYAELFKKQAENYR